jgi:hypothetical protein
VSSDGLVWTIDGNASGASQLKPGAVLFASSLGAGRVLAVDDVGLDKRVALGPIAITDLIRDADIRTAQPISADNFEAYNTPDAPGLQTSEDDMNTQQVQTSAWRSTDGADAVLAVARGAPALPTMPAPTKQIPTGTVGKWTTYSICCTKNGIHVTYTEGGLRVQGTAEFVFTQPSLDFHLRIGGSHVLDAGVKLNGAADLKFGISVATQASSDNRPSGRIQLPVDIDIPIVIGGLPFNVSFSQLFSIKPGLSGAAALSTDGEYALGGSLGFELKGTSATALFPTLTTVSSALDNIHSLAVASQGLTFSYALKTSIGVGPPQLSAGVWYQVASTLSFVTSGAQLDPIQGTSLVTCKRVAVDVEGRYGVGYRIPNLVAKAINAVLSLIMKNPPPPVKPVAGPEWGPTPLFHKETPPCSKGHP